MSMTYACLYFKDCKDHHHNEVFVQTQILIVLYVPLRRPLGWTLRIV